MAFAGEWDKLLNAVRRSVGTFDASPPDPALFDPRQALDYLRLRCLPWSRRGDHLVYGSWDVRRAEADLRSRHAVDGRSFEVRYCRRATLETHVARLGQRTLVHEAVEGLRSRDASLSAHRPLRGHGPWLVALGLGLVALAIAAPTVAIGLAVAGSAAVAAFRSALLAAGLGARATLPEAGDLPTVTLLVPLRDEEAILPRLVEHLRALDYPRRLLEVLLLVEEDDPDTARAARHLRLPPGFRVLTVPTGGPATKPKAMQYALPFTAGAIIGIYDAEDRPARDQLRKVAGALGAAGPEVGGVQARLNFDHGDRDALARCACAEYAVWFDAMLPGLARLGLPVPLGGTSIFVRRGALEAAGGWDPRNVTEDADLGIRLARAGYRVPLIDSTTHEEPIRDVGAWVKQRSRWVKGFMVTLLVLLRDPRRVRREMGTLPALAAALLLADGAFSFLVGPLGWAILFGGLVWGGVSWWLLAPLGLAQAALLGAAFVATRRRFGARRALWALALPIYWLLGLASALLALRELASDPAGWAKTPHGHVEAGLRRRPVFARYRRCQKAPAPRRPRSAWSASAAPRPSSTRSASSRG